MRVTVAVLALFVLAPLACRCQEPPAQAGPLVGSTWCVVRTGRTETQQSASTGGKVPPGCDVGLGLALATYRRVSLVAVVGTTTVGVGVGWIVWRPSARFNHAIAVAAGVVSPHDSTGISGRVYPALGATLSFGRGPADP